MTEAEIEQQTRKEILRARAIHNLSYHRPHGDQQERYGEIRNTARGFADILIRCCPESRELSIALTQLEDTVMWANAAIARNETEHPET